MSAAFRCKVGDFSASTASEKLGSLIAASAELGFATYFHKQTEAWQTELDMLGRFCSALPSLVPGSQDWWLLFEFEIPRRGKRPDVILLAGDLIILIEFKIGAASFSSADQWQVTSYALDLRDFHAESSGRKIHPLLVATGDCARAPARAGDDRAHGRLVFPVQCISDGDGEGVAKAVAELVERHGNRAERPIEPIAWENSPYRPTPSIIECARELFSGHEVANISHAFATNLDVTCRELLSAIDKAQKSGERIVCFVTGIPGAGKTLAGLNAVHDPAMRGDGRPAAVFLSGNGPLVKIVRAALVSDCQKAGASAKEAQRTVSTFIDNVHRFINTYGIRDREKPPYENAIVFDEAQRAWNSDAVYRAHKIRRSEPELILDIMARAPNWCAIIALVGGGQEIHKGEAGLEEWGAALNSHIVPWTVYASPSVLRGDNTVAGHRLFQGSVANSIRLLPSSNLHLDVSVRSPRARRISDWVSILLSPEAAGETLDPAQSQEFPIVLTRDIKVAREWLRTHSDGEQRCGLLASSGALRLRTSGIEVSSGFRHGFPYEEWFLAGRDDFRSSNALEVAATEFECQGLEVDWSCVCWGGDFVFRPDDRRWLCRKLRGAKWQKVRNELEVRYVVNKYRVLLTRARRGMVLWVPRGTESDTTNEPALFDATASYLESLGVPVVV